MGQGESCAKVWGRKELYVLKNLSTTASIMLIQTSDSMLRCDSSAECFCNWATKFKSSVPFSFASSCQWHSCFAIDDSRDPLGTTVPLAAHSCLYKFLVLSAFCRSSALPPTRPHQLLVLLRAFTESVLKPPELSTYTKERTFERKPPRLLRLLTES